jgi:hypothetical protein
VEWEGMLDQPKMWKCSIEQLYQSPVVSKFQDTRNIRPYVGLLGSESGVALFCEAVVDGLATMLQEDHICVQTSSYHLCVTVCLQLVGSAWLFFEENPAFHVNCHWGLLTVWSSNFQEWSSTSHYLNMSRVPFSIWCLSTSFPLLHYSSLEVCSLLSWSPEGTWTM